MKTYVKDFGKGIKCTIEMLDSKPAEHQGHIISVKWDGKPTQAVARPYVAWMNSINSALAKEWGIKLAHVIQTSPTTYELWNYYPDKCAKMERIAAPPGATTFEECLALDAKLAKRLGLKVEKVDTNTLPA